MRNYPARRLGRILAVLTTAGLLLFACSSSALDEFIADPDEDHTVDDASTGAGDDTDEYGDQSDTDTQADTNDAAPSADTSLGADVDSIDCDDYGFGTDEEVTFIAVYRVVDARLGDLCFGEPNPPTEAAWKVLTDITPRGQLLDLGLFAGFEPSPFEQAQTLAFVNPLDDDGVLYQMSVNAEVAANEPTTLTITLAHELTHVFTALPFELDRNADYDSCETYWNGEGCYTFQSLMASWIADFWSDGLINEIDPSRPASELEDDGYERCQYEPRFFGSYAASSPEEDFAEAFGAYVLRVPPATDQQQEKLDWIAARPGLREFQEQAIAAGYGPDANTFDSCGDLVGN